MPLNIFGDNNCYVLLSVEDSGVVGSGSRAGPVVTPHTLELTPRGRVILQMASPETARAYLPPEYRPGRLYSDTESEKMWMYSLGRALLDTTPRVAALTGSVSVSPPSALQSVLAAMIEPDPQRRASLMNLLDVISEYCRTRMISKPFTRIVMDMYREVIRSPQYIARNRAASSRQLHPHRWNQRTENNEKSIPPSCNYTKPHHVKGQIFKAQSRNSRSHPNLPSVLEPSTLHLTKHQFKSQTDIKSNGALLTDKTPSHIRTNSQPIYSECPNKPANDSEILNLANRKTDEKIPISVYSEPIYAFPVKPFLSSQDVRVNGLTVKHTQNQNSHYIRPNGKINLDPTTANNNCNYNPNPQKHIKDSHLGQVPFRSIEIIPDSSHQNRPAHLALHRQYSSPQIQSRNLAGQNLRSNSVESIIESQKQYHNQHQQKQKLYQNPDKIYHSQPQEQMERHQESTYNVQSSVVNNAVTNYSYPGVISLPEPPNNPPPPKPPRNLQVRNGPRARRGKPVQRAPSRLYRALGGPVRCLNKTQCVGPEFVVRANQPSKFLKIGDPKGNNVGRLVVILLSGQRIDVVCDRNRITASHLFQAIIQAEQLEENFTLGLAALLAGDFAMLPPETKLHKVAPPGWLNDKNKAGPLCLPTSFMLYLRQRFFLPSLRGIRSWISKHLLYLQIRRCILEQQLVCSVPQLVNLTGLALQAEFGNYNENEHGRGNYFLLEHYVPETLILSNSEERSQVNLSNETLTLQLHQAHQNRRGLDPNTAEELFITHSQELDDYGLHLYIATIDARELNKIIQQLSKESKLKKINYQPNDTIVNVEGKENVYAIPKNISPEVNKSVKSNDKNNKVRKAETNIWFGIYGQGVKLFKRAGQVREITELVRLEWRDIHTLTYSKNGLVIYTKQNGRKHLKFHLKMDHKKSYYAFNLTSLHHQFFQKFRSGLTSHQDLIKDFGVALVTESSANIKSKSKVKVKIGSVTKAANVTDKSLEDSQNKENENPDKDSSPSQISNDSVCYTPEDDGLYAQVNARLEPEGARLEPEGASRDTEDESERAQLNERDKLDNCRVFRDDAYNYQSIGQLCKSIYDIPKLMSSNGYKSSDKVAIHPEELYAAIDKSGGSKKNQLHVYRSTESASDWNAENDAKNYSKIKTSSLPSSNSNPASANLQQDQQGSRTPSLPRRLGVKMGTRAIYGNSLAPKDSADEFESMSLKSDSVSSIRSLVHSNESPMAEAYVLNADLRIDDETFHISNDETMSTSLMARLEELSFVEERILRTIKLERGHGGSIGLQVTEGNDGGVYVQAISVGGSADMAGNINKGDRIVAINGHSLLNFRYEDALKLLQNSSCQTIELVLSQIINHSNYIDNYSCNQDNIKATRNQLQSTINDKSDNSLDTQTTSSLTSRWLAPSKSCDPTASVQNTSSAYSSAASSTMGNYDAKNFYNIDGISRNGINSASILINIEDLDISSSSHQVFI
ncbi:hypothetical protein KQX54_005883 [Cotesia glomerata]|uniref:Tyrosine-protein phosphatase non-receptor type 13 n=1 Tax=Cotesia glomerata TaxID=32391 RepID=A0AAV7IGJ2_COTGL|nr:hypothetical protein KQX54_005883 [Cotesia glomerata]